MNNGSRRRERGFAAMNSDKQKEIAKKGGEAVSRNREHMAAIGRRGGESVSRNREHMAEIGRRGGEARGEDGRGSGHMEGGDHSGRMA